MGGAVSSQSMTIINEVMQRITQSVFQSHSTTINNLVDVTQVNKLKIGKTARILCKELNITQLNATKMDMKYLDSVSNEMANDLKAQLTSEVNNTVSQIQKIIRDISLSSSNDQQTMDIITRINQVINSSVNVETLNKILRQTVTFQGNDLVINGTIEGDLCNIRQANDLQLKMFAQTVTSNIVTNVLDDQIINRIVNDIKQSQEIVQVGLASLLLAVGLCALSCLAGLASTLKAGADPLLKALGPILLVLTLLVIAYLLIAYFVEIWPFQNSHYGCEISATGIATGQCVQIPKSDPDFEKKGIFKTKDACMDAVKKGQACFQYHGCESDGATKLHTGKCAQFKSPLDGPYKTQLECENSIRTEGNCQITWRCAKGATGYNTEPPTCAPYNWNDFPNENQQSEASCNATKAVNCKSYFECQKIKGKNPQCLQREDDQTIFPTFPTAEQCTQNCK